ncbi:Hypothetical_protein [Hexamita inflata]|uniref:Hypothetical_protein n=1 Tax=Hexamita inflata TaxID=28002 RepID=A0AA86R260_9EUKA|nr:Hypothetical protein HINF_LOCUS55422 [Hexamita inflata]
MIVMFVGMMVTGIYFCCTSYKYQFERYYSVSGQIFNIFGDNINYPIYLGVGVGLIIVGFFGVMISVSVSLASKQQSFLKASSESVNMVPPMEQQYIAFPNLL